MNPKPKYPFEYPPYDKTFTVTIYGEEHKARLMPHRYGYIELLDVGPDDRRIYPIGTIRSWHE